MASDGLLIFHPLIRSWFSAAVGEPTDIQLKTWPEIAAGKHVLVTAPTGSGKTLAAFLWSLNQLVIGAWPPGRLRVLYVSPLKALNNDVRRNLLRPLVDLKAHFEKAGEKFPDISVQTRSGDTPGEERRRMIRKPPEILITTPESLNLLLSSKSGRTMLTDIATVILDEIHAVMDDKRGTHLITAVDRLVPLSGEFQRVALSATVNPMERVASFVGGFTRTGRGAESLYEKRPVTIIRSRAPKDYELTVSLPTDAGNAEGDEGIWPALTRAFKKIIAEHSSTLFFAISRRTTEKVTRFLNENEPADIAYAHHGSLSREIRLAVEEKLKRGELKAIVATNSLELGIDIGSLDQVVLIQTPRSVSSTLQRIGRSGHSVGGTSKGLLFPLHGADLVDAAVMARAVEEQDIEEVRPIEGPLDVLAQVILSMTAMEVWDIDELYAFLRTSFPYHGLPRRQFDLVLEMLAGRYADSRLRELKPRVSIDRVDNTIQARGEVRFLLYSSGGTIPERGYFDLRLKDGKAKIGELDEEFVWERSIGETFTLGSQLWRIVDITHNDVLVTPSRGGQGIFPFWRAEEQNRDFHLSQRIGLFLEHADNRLENDEFRKELSDRYSLESEAADGLISYLKRQHEATGAKLPHRHHLLIEHVHDPEGHADTKQVILHTLWGGRVNRPFALALSVAWEERYRYPLQIVVNDDALSLMLPHDLTAGDLFQLVTPANVEGLLRKKLEQTGFFGARFRENAERALLLPKTSFKRRMPLWLMRLRSKRLLEAVRPAADFPILIETWRTSLRDEFDLERLKQLLDEIDDREIILSECRTAAASPFAAGLVWKQTNAAMYADDTPLLAKESGLKPELIRELLFSSHLRPKVPAEVISLLDRKLKRTAPDYAPLSSIELLDWIKERFLVPEPEWMDLIQAIAREGGEGPAWLDEQGAKLLWMSWEGAAYRMLAALENVPPVLEGMGLRLEDVSFTPVASSGNAATVRRQVEQFIQTSPHRSQVESEEQSGLADLLSNWLSYYGPIGRSRVRSLLGLSDERIEQAIEELIEQQELVMDRFSDASTEEEICDSRNLEMLLRMARRRRQPVFEALAIEQLPFFLALFQGVLHRGESMEDLQQRVEQLFGWPAPAPGWEESILPARMRPYRGEWLDRLMTESDLIWFGSGKERLSLAFRQDLDLFHGPPGEGEVSTRAELDRLLPDRRGRYGLLEIADAAHLDSAAAADILWQQAWEGHVTTDSFRSIRKGIVTGFNARAVSEGPVSQSRRSGFNRWKVSRPLEGNWLRIDIAETGQQDVIARDELVKDRVRQLLRRYGVLFRELLTNELPLLQWREVFRTLRLMELSGEVLSGWFFRDVRGLQFISPEAFRMLKEPLPADAVYWLSATDPASLCGLALEPLRQQLPPRIASTHLVYHGSRLVLISKRLGRALDIRVEPDDPNLREYFAFFKDLLGREFRPLTRISVEEINGMPALGSDYERALRAFGFRPSRTTLDLWREY
jgi:ATP-dependent helicase Lhr and Lhr-like helicase